MTRRFTKQCGKRGTADLQPTAEAFARLSFKPHGVGYAIGYVQAECSWPVLIFPYPNGKEFCRRHLNLGGGNTTLALRNCEKLGPSSTI